MCSICMYGVRVLFLFFSISRRALLLNLKNKPKMYVFKPSVNICSCVKRQGVTHPSYRLHLSTHIRPRIKYLQERHWSGPGPQHPASEHSGSHTMCFLAAHEKDNENRQKHKSKIRFHVHNCPTKQCLRVFIRLPSLLQHCEVSGGHIWGSNTFRGIMLFLIS